MVLLELTFLASVFFHLLSIFVVFLLLVIVLLAGFELLLLFIAVVLLIFLLAFGTILSFDFLFVSVFAVFARGGCFHFLLFLSVIFLISAFDFSFFLEFSLGFRIDLGRDLLNVGLVCIAALDDSSVELIGGLMILDLS